MLFWLLSLSQAFEDRHFRNFQILVFRRNEAEQENDQNEGDRDCAHGLFTCRKSLSRRSRVRRQAMDSRWQTRNKRPSLSLGGFDLSSRYFLKRSEIEISENLIFLRPVSKGKDLALTE
jgi:hypothetical protein